MNWIDRLTGNAVSTLPLQVEPGRYWTKVQTGFLADGIEHRVDGLLLSPGSLRFHLDGQLHEFIADDKALAAQADLFTRSLLTLRGATDRMVSPLMPAAVINERSHLLHFEQQLQAVIEQGHLHQISLRPRLDLHYEEEVTDIARARRLARGALTHLASHSECWQRQTLNGVVPRKVLARFSQDDYGIYENRAYARLLDKVEVHLLQRLNELEQLRRTLDQALEFYEATDVDYSLRERICRLWGQTFDASATSKAISLLESTYETLASLLKVVQGLKRSGLYLLVDRNAQVGDALHLTNILGHDAHYRHVAILWGALSRLTSAGRCSPQERYQQSQELASAYTHYAGLMLRHALQPFMQFSDEAEWAGRRLRLEQQGAEWLLRCDDETLLRLVPWLYWQKHPPQLAVADSSAPGVRMVAWPALDCLSNQQADEGGYVSLSPFDLYGVERFGLLVDRILMRHAAGGYARPLCKVPGKPLELARQLAGQGGGVRLDGGHQFQLVSLLNDENLVQLQQQLDSSNAKALRAELRLRQDEIKALSCCPVCRENGQLELQVPEGFRLVCKCCGSSLYLRSKEDRRELELCYAESSGAADFQRLGRRAFQIRWTSHGSRSQVNELNRASPLPA